MLILENGKYIVQDEDDLSIFHNIDINAIKQEKLLYISDTRDSLIEDGFTINNTKYGFNKTDQQNMLETLTLLNTKLLSGVSNPTVYYKPYGIGVMREYSLNEFMEVVMAAEQHKTTIWNKYNSLVLSIDNAKTVEELNEIAWS